MTDFFDLSEVITTSSDHLCSDCGLFKNCKSPKMGVTGEGRLKTLIITEAPGKDEDDRNKQLVGKVGQFFRGLLSSRGFDLDKDFWKMGAVSCRPPDDREPTIKEIMSCRPRVEKAVRDKKPKFIFLLGSSAIESFFGTYFSDTSPTRWRCTCVPDQKNNAWIIPIFHPSFALRNEDDPLIMSQYIRDLEFALNCIKTKESVDRFAVPDMDCISVMTDFDTICDTLEDLIDNPPETLAFDYETTGLKPYRKGHKIVSVSFCYSYEKAFSFPLRHKYWSKTPSKIIHLEKLWSQVLKNNSSKVAQGMKFEDVWSRICLKTTPSNWFWCTEITAHILDNRPKFAGLKFQSFINWGVPNYSKEIKPFLETTDERGFNRVEQAPLNKLLLYGGQDSLLLYWLFKKQCREIDNHLLKGVDLFTEGSLTLADMQIHGINVDTTYYKAAHVELQERIKQRLSELLKFDECKEFKKQKGFLPNLSSSDDLREMFFEILKLKPPKVTAKGNNSVDAESLAKLDTPLAKEITALNKIKKVDSTYLSQFLREIDDDGRIHPFFSISHVKTYRGCVAKGTLIHVVRDFIKHPNGVPIETVQKGDYVYCFDDNLEPAIRKVLWAGKTGHKKVLRLHWQARGRKGHVDVTPEHLIRLTTGDYVPAKDFSKKDFPVRNKKKHDAFKRTLALCRKNDELYFSNNTKNGHGVYEHRLIYKELIGTLQKKEVVHHKNKIHLDHSPSNLEKMEMPVHSRIHNIGKKYTETTRKKISDNTKKTWKEGKYSHIGEMLSLHISKLGCIRILAKNKGVYSKGVCGHDFSSFKNLLKKYGVDPSLIKLRYDKNGRYITKKRFLEAYNEGITYTRKTFGHSYYRLKKLYAFFGVPFQRRWGNQNGSFVPHNHIIYKVENLYFPVDVYDLEVEEFNNFFANEICVHNSSNKPNFQNIPVRNEEAKRYARSGIIPSKGWRLLDWDYSAIEVCMGGCYTKDPVLIDYIKDPTTDMHRDTAIDIFVLQNAPAEFWKDPNSGKKLRFYSKNGFVFPEWYGSYYANCAKNIWNNCADLYTHEGISIVEHLKNVGVIEKKNKALDDFTHHIKNVEKAYWKKFKVFKKWQDGMYKKYEATGIVELLTGFRCKGFLGRNEIVNYSFQGTAFHCLLWSLIHINAELKERKMESKINIQIHDNGVIDSPPDECDEVQALCTEIATQRIKKEFPWLIVPLSIEWESTGIDESWFLKKDI